MDLFTSPLEDEEMSLRELAMSSMKDIEMQKSYLALATTHYEVKRGIIKLVATKPFRGLEDDNPYRHIKEFTMLCNTVQQKGVLAARSRQPRAHAGQGADPRHARAAPGR
jgi:hypothetical protein